MKRQGQPKRRRAMIGEGSSRNPTLVQEANERQMMAKRRDWSSLPDLVLDSISELLLSEDVSEYMRFRAVCSDWRRSTAPPSNTESCFRPRNWILITNGRCSNFYVRKIINPCCFFNISNGNYLRVNIPHFRQGYTLISTVDGLLVLLKKSTGELCLLNPFSLSRSELPNANSLLAMVSCKSYIQRHLRNVNILQSTVVVFCFRGCTRVAFARIRGDKWIDLDSDVSFSSIMSFQGQLYAVTHSDREVMQFEFEKTQNELCMEPKLNMKTLIQPKITPYESGGYHSLLELDGQMLLLQDYPFENCFKVYKVDVENKNLIPTTIPRDRIVIVSESRSLSISTSVNPSLLPHSLFYYRWNGPSITIYHSPHPNVEPEHFNYPYCGDVYCNGLPFKAIGPVSLLSHLICHCANFHMPPDSWLYKQNW